MKSTLTNNPCGDAWFGPVVATGSCRGGFDFTVLFESTLLNIAPATCFLLLAAFRLVQLYRRSPKVRTSRFRSAIAIASICLAAIQLILLILVSTKALVGGPASLAAAVLDVIAALTIIVLVDLEHVRSIRPSFLVSTYLFITVLLDVARVRTAWLLPTSRAYPACLSVFIVAKLSLLVLENVDKRKRLLPSEKEKSGESVSGPFSRALFAWLNDLLKTDYSVFLTSDALPTIHEKLSSHDLSPMFARAWENCNQNRKNALLLAVVKCLRWDMVSIAIPRLGAVGFGVAQPFLMGKAVIFLQQGDAFSPNVGYGLIGATAIVFIGVAVCKACYEHLGYRATTMLRGGLMALVFQHMMDLPVGSTDESSAMSLMGSDIEMLAEYFQSTVCETWANVLQLGLATWLLETQIGAACIAPIVVVIAFTAASFAMGNAVSTRQKTWLQATEKRINFTTAVLGSIRNVKFLGLTETLRDMIEAFRVDELNISKKFRRLQTVRVCMVNLPQVIGQLATFAAYAVVAAVQGSDGLSVSQAITSLSLISLIVNPLSYLLMAIPDTFASIGCLHRIQDFLRNPARRECPLWMEQGSTEKAGITFTLLESPTGNLVIITGPVGSGKSTFLKGISGETPVLDGSLLIRYPDLALCEQAPWLANASIRDNILGETSYSEFDPTWYSTVLNACALDMDIQRLPARDETVVGSKGTKLSGGQKQRIAIARALYARKRIACFDDVLSGLDNVTSQWVFDHVFGPAGLLRQLGCTVFLATHSAHYLPQADYILVLGDEGGSFKQANYHQLESNTGRYVQLNPFRRTPVEQPGHADKAQLNSDEEGDIAELPTAGPLAEASSTDTKRQNTTDFAVYKYYFSALGGLRIFALLCFLTVEAGISGFRYVWVELWSSSSSSNSRLGYWLGVYGALSFVQSSALILAVFWVWVVIVPAASKNLHARILHACMSAPLSFLSNVETGTLVTRFSQDMRLVDMILPRAFINTGFQIFAALAQGAVAIASLPYLAATLPFLIGVLVLIQRFYLRTSRQLRLLEIELKSPLYTHFIESLAGLTTIRAFSWTQASTSKMLSMLDTAQKPYYLLICIQRWLDLVLNLIVAGLTILLVGAAVALRTRVDPGLLGIALVMMMDLGQILSHLIQSWTLLETSLGAIARIKSFAEETPSEEQNLSSQCREQYPEWPSGGEIVFSNASIAYGLFETHPVLHNIDLHFSAGQKIGLCGRTGSGKSTLALSLLRLNELVSGQICIDGQDISDIPRSLVRERISCLGQGPFLFPGTIRQNADPQGTLASADIIDALRCVGVWDILAASHEKTDEDLLDTKLDDGMLSQGQQQLFCLARALLKKSKVLILDEPTSSLDMETDIKVQKIIRELFHNCTVVMVAHRIRSLLDFDRIAVLDGGRVVETGNPRELLKRPNGQFSKLLNLES
ncbi:multidrug resistance-associated protein [Penicillium hispanicum]|uniref:multidrug resistance-associated protein n=1 Tax=Penicillium hispanicum TaxID=1080232 RepID=UPI0025421E41|nr:multidrug resistance-associated protein [Penicillium hispanicum]KAJ5591589.1 multidrug resistance-associated protein [Penicillium hispanicum]